MDTTTARRLGVVVVTLLALVAAVTTTGPAAAVQVVQGAPAAQAVPAGSLEAHGTAWGANYGLPRWVRLEVGSTRANLVLTWTAARDVRGRLVVRLPAGLTPTPLQAADGGTELVGSDSPGDVVVRPTTNGVGLFPDRWLSGIGGGCTALANPAGAALPWSVRTEASGASSVVVDGVSCLAGQRIWLVVESVALDRAGTFTLSAAVVERGVRTPAGIDAVVVRPATGRSVEVVATLVPRAGLPPQVRWSATVLRDGAVDTAFDGVVGVLTGEELVTCTPLATRIRVVAGRGEVVRGLLRPRVVAGETRAVAWVLESSADPVASPVSLDAGTTPGQPCPPWER